MKKNRQTACNGAEAHGRSIMCGICGYIGPKEISEETLRKMNQTMLHRGPDDGGIWQSRNNERNIGMAHRRLSILDLSQMGHQPMWSQDRRYVIVYNGEVYNYRELRTELETEGFRFCSDCDTEVVLNSYIRWGAACFRRFNGMFAAAIYDCESGELILARDRVGKKPLYYYDHDGHFVFASELKPIMEYPFFRKEIDQDMIGAFLCNKYLAAPFCIFQNIYKLLPGSILIYHKGELRQSLYWDVAEEYVKNRKYIVNHFPKAVASTKEILIDSVKRRMVADVPIGTVLSGGIDSTLVTAIAQNQSEYPIDTYSIGFYDKERDEAPYAAEIAKHLGTNHHEHYVSEKDILNLIGDMTLYYDEPFSDSSQLPTMLVSGYASEGISVALSGDGGDEIFCGYRMYDWTWVAQHADVLGAIAAHIPGMRKLEGSLPPEVRAFIHNRQKDVKTQLFMDVMVEEADKLLGRQVKYAKHSYEAQLSMQNWQERRMLLDMRTYLPDEVMAKTDRASMRYSLEVRSPLLDHRLIEQSFRIPHSYKYHHFEKKYLLKELTYQYVPKTLLDRPKKGFGVPLRKWLRTVLRDEVKQYAEKCRLKKQGIFVPDAVDRLIMRQEHSDKIMYSSMLWSFYVFQKWYQRYIEDLWRV